MRNEVERMNGQSVFPSLLRLYLTWKREKYAPDWTFLTNGILKADVSTYGQLKYIGHPELQERIHRFPTGCEDRFDKDSNDSTQNE